MATRLDKATIKLREAAVAWVCALDSAPINSRDSAFRKLDSKLKRAAVHFAHAKETKVDDAA